MLEQIKQTGGKQAYRWNGGISRKQMKWLDDLLGKCERNHNNVLIFTHHPLYPQSEFTALNNMEILNTISKYPCVKLYSQDIIMPGHLDITKESR